MAFLKHRKSNVAGESAVANAVVCDGEHPLLRLDGITDDLREWYFRGCVLAVLIDDERVSENERYFLHNLGVALHLSVAEIQSGIDFVETLTSDAAKDGFVANLLARINRKDIAVLFMADFESIVDLNEQLNADLLDYLNYFGEELFKRMDWRDCIWEYESKIDEEQVRVRYEKAAAAGDKYAIRVLTLVDATGKPSGVRGDVLIVDVSSGEHSATYPTFEFTDVDLGKFNCDVYKMDKIVLRKIAVGNYFCHPGSHDEVKYKISLPQAYYIGIFAITHQQYVNVMGNCASNAKDARCPVENISWNVIRGGLAVTQDIDANSPDSFMRRLVARTGLRGFDLPTENQWETAARADSASVMGAYWDGVNSIPVSFANINEVAWFHDNSYQTTHIVGEKMPNCWGLYDTAGNVWEWCREFYNCSSGNYGGSRVLRGGSYRSIADYCRPSCRIDSDASSSYYDLSFRLVRNC